MLKDTPVSWLPVLIGFKLIEFLKSS
jgi:hypothetical protein